MTLGDLLAARARTEPARLAYAWLANGRHVAAELTYGELDAKARAMGALLVETAEPGARALLLYPPGLDFVVAFFGCLYAGIVAVPVYPPDPRRLDRSLERLTATAADARPTLVVTTDEIRALARELAPALPLPRRWVTSESAQAGRLAWTRPAIDPAALAFLQYTSGSTRVPRGVMVTHRNLMENLDVMCRVFRCSPASVCVSWLPTFHDMGLIGAVLEPVYAGFPSYLMSPATFLERPVRWLEAIATYRATVAPAPNFAYDLCVRRTTGAERASLALDAWAIALNGAEPVRADTLARFTEAFAPCGFRAAAFAPAYGLAEATLCVSGKHDVVEPGVMEVSRAMLERCTGEATGDVRSVVSTGRVATPNEVVIVDPATRRPCPPDGVGEIWVAGPSVAAGYWGRADETEATFRATLADGGGPYLRTGDLGFLHDGELFVTGRLTDLIVLRGRNVRPEDVEHAVAQSHPALRPGCCAAFAIEVDGAEHVAVVAEIDRRWDGARPPALARHEVERAMRRAVAEEVGTELRAVMLLKAGSIPKTSSGKIQRHACRAGLLAGSLDAWG
jgi:acyl-CoA synthetase (AMP-forming)/AMP-acid ligase II